MVENTPHKNQSIVSVYTRLPFVDIMSSICVLSRAHVKSIKELSSYSSEQKTNTQWRKKKLKVDGFDIGRKSNGMENACHSIFFAYDVFTGQLCIYTPQRC